MDAFQSITIPTIIFISPVRTALKKQKINITLDPDVIAWFKARAGGRGYQTLINAALREAMDRASLEETLRRIIREEMQPALTSKQPAEKVHP